MDATTLIASLHEAVPAAAVEPVPTVDLHTTIQVSPDHLADVARALRDGSGFRFSVLLDITAVDFHPREPRFEVVYHLVSIDERARLRLKVALAGDAPQVPSLTPIWPAANWLEREVWDLFGIIFAGHPDPRRLLMPEDWEGFPLRKDYPVQIRMTPRASEPLQVTEEEFRQNVERDRLTRR
jgi:NADH-quinone oxidoreductase subunit C